MSTINGISFQDPRNLNLKGGALGTGVIRFAPAPSGSNGNWATNPFSSTDYGLYVNSSGNLVFSSVGSTTILGAAGQAVVPTWAQIFAGSTTFQLAGTTWTIDNNTGNNNLLTITNSGAGSGHCIQITNVGTGKDINGSSGLWSVSKAGAAVLVSVDVPTIATTGALTMGASGASLITIGTNSNTITMAKATTFSSTIVVTDGLTDLISTSNAASALRVTNNTLTTFGAAAAANAGAIVLRSTSVTTGSMLRIQTAEATLTTGKYLEAYDTTGSAAVFSVAKAGATTILGSAFATAALTLSAGDFVVTSGKLLATAASNAGAAFVFTNNTATSVNVFGVTGSGVHTGTGASGFFTVTQSGATSGTVAAVIANGLTTGKVFQVTSTGVITGMLVSLVASGLTTGTALDFGTLAALTTGVGFKMAHTTSVIADTGSLMRLSSSSNDTGGATNGTLLDLGSTASTAGTLVKLVDTALTTGTAVLWSGSGVYSGSGFYMVTQNGATTGSVAVITANGLTTGKALTVTSSGVIATSGRLVNLVATGLTTGSAMDFGTLAAITTGTGILMAHTTSVIADGGSLVRLSSSAADTGGATNGTVLDLGSTGSTAGTVVKLTDTALTTGIAVNVVGTGVYTGTGYFVITQNSATLGTIFKLTANGLTTGNAMTLTSSGTIATTGNMLAITANSATTPTGLITVSATGLTSGVALLITGSGTGTFLTSGSLVSLNMSTSTVGAALKIAGTGVYTDTSSAVVNISASGATVGNVLAVAAPSTKTIIAGNTLANPAFQLDTSTGSSVSGVLMKSNASGLGFAISLQSSGAAEPFFIDAKGTGRIDLGATSTGSVYVNRGAKKALVIAVTKTALATQNITPTGAQIIGGYISHASVTGGGTCTFDTGTNISAQVIGVAVGDSFDCLYANTGNQTVTLTTNTGLTLVGSTVAITTLKVAYLKFVNTGSNTWDVFITASA